MVRHIIEPLRDHANDGASPFGNLPEWDLSDLYKGPDAPEIERDLNALEQMCTNFAADFEGKVIELDAAQLLTCLDRQENIQKLAGRLMSFAQLRYQQRTTDADRGKFLADCTEKVTQCSSCLIFFPLEVNTIEEDQLARMMAENAALARYKPEFDRLRAMKPYQLSEELEKCLHDLSIVNASWGMLFDETITGLSFDIDDETLNLDNALNLLTDPNRDQRETSARELAAVFGKNIKIFTRIFNAQIKEKEIIDRWRKMPSPQTGRHLANQVEPEVVEALRSTVVEAYPKLSHRYYALKRNWLELDSLQIWDRNAPLPIADTRVIDWTDARETVLGAFASFSPNMADIAKKFFDNNWIDAGARQGKSPGAFAHPTVTNVHPYVLLNYLGKSRDVMTLAHELGHGVHQVLASSQGELLSTTPLTLAETASVFGEMLTFRKILDSVTDTQQRKVLIANKVEDMINTVVRQIAFYDFECKLHDARRHGELTPDAINSIWMSVQQDSLGPAFEFMPGYETFWAYIPHFVHTPFYVYAYAFGDGLVSALYSVYESGAADFENQYLKLLKAGGSKNYSELLQPFGLDATNPQFWGKGIDLIAQLIDELEALD
ncbi:MAG: M3 family oligoendopeptidase [Aestuariivita sp.]|nr:M3 family oligoendopeptidase [Aestuariivita sp.]